jgi:hypothetical protein
LATHQQLVRGAIERHGGVEVSTAGDGFFIAFGSADDAVAAAEDAQRSLAGHAWSGGSEVRVRMGVHTGRPQLITRNYPRARRSQSRPGDVGRPRWAGGRPIDETPGRYLEERELSSSSTTSNRSLRRTAAFGLACEGVGTAHARDEPRATAARVRARLRCRALPLPATDDLHALGENDAVSLFLARAPSR